MTLQIRNYSFFPWKFGERPAMQKDMQKDMQKGLTLCKRDDIFFFE